MAYYYKSMFQLDLKRDTDAIMTTKALIRIKPTDPRAYMTIGFLYEKTGDSISSTFYFQEALMRLNSILDSTNHKNEIYDEFMSDKALALIMLGRQTEGNELLEQVSRSANNPLLIESIQQFRNKNKKELFKMITDPPSRSDTSQMTIANP
jgi:hypothetical protein